jgi:hypothetical protein
MFGYLTCRIPKDVLHSVPTALLLSLEGMPGLDWDRLFKLQSPDGSFLSSAAPTAYALMQTGNKKCLEYLTDIVHKFNGGGVCTMNKKSSLISYIHSLQVVSVDCIISST